MMVLKHRSEKKLGLDGYFTYVNLLRELVAAGYLADVRKIKWWSDSYVEAELVLKHSPRFVSECLDQKAKAAEGGKEAQEGLIRIQTFGSYPSWDRTFSARGSGHTAAVSEMLEWLSKTLLREAIEQDHAFVAGLGGEKISA